MTWATPTIASSCAIALAWASRGVAELMPVGARKKPSRRERKRSGVARHRPRATLDDVVAQVKRQVPEQPPIRSVWPLGVPSRGEQPGVKLEPLGDLTYLSGDIRRIAILACLMFLLLGIVAVVLR